ncbi:MAG: hypothetical protein DCC49_05250 [Acidobacteria bacterium]|nr:MAG: hypothetical protein DCC49_05250 [Acidobacteriota bacterium]
MRQRDCAQRREDSPEFADPAEPRRARPRAARNLFRAVVAACVLTSIAAAALWWIDTRDLSGKDLSGRNFAGHVLNRRDFSGSNLTEAVFSGAKLVGADLSGADMSRASLQNADLTDANLEGANLAGANLTGATMARALLRGANFRGTHAYKINLEKADLSEAKLDDAYLERAMLTDTNLAGAEITTKTSLLGAIGLSDASFASAFGILEEAVPRILIEKKLLLENENEMETGVAAACVGQTVPGTSGYRDDTDYHPVLAFASAPQPDEYYRYNAFTQLGWEPRLRRHLQIVACLDYGNDLVQRCPGAWYFDDTNKRADLRRVRKWTRIRLISPADNRLIAEFKVYGGDPPACPSRTFSGADPTGAMHGSMADSSQVREAVQPYVVGETHT